MNSHPLSEELRRINQEVARHIVGQDQLIERLIVALVADGHVLLEGVPGLAKTRSITTLAGAVSGTVNRVQFTADLLPSDLVGTEVYRPQTGVFETRKGPLFANFVLADEINRAPAKVQSALLQAMQEHKVTIGDTTFDLPHPFFVLATQNPIEHEGTFPLPEAQLDRFCFKLVVGYPAPAEELAILRLADGAAGYVPEVRQVLSLPQLEEIRRYVQTQIRVDERIDKYIVQLVNATREPALLGMKGMVSWGASPRGGISLRAAAKALSFIRGNTFVSPDEIKELAADALRHRIVISFDGETRGITSETVIAAAVKTVAVP